MLVKVIFRGEYLGYISVKVGDKWQIKWYIKWGINMYMCWVGLVLYEINWVDWG